MTPLYGYSLVPVLSVALLLFFTTARRGRGALGLALYCLSVACWCFTLILCLFPRTAPVGQRLAASGTFCCASYLHAAYDATGQRSYGLVVLSYLGALFLTLLGALMPGLLYSPVTLRAGPMFWPGMALAVVAVAVPSVQLALAYPRADAEKRRYLRLLLLAAGIGYGGAWSNAILLSHGIPLPYGMFAVLASLVLLANIVGAHEPPPERRLLERSLLHSALAALLSAGFLFGVMSLLSAQAEPLLQQYRLGALFLLFLAALAFEPLRQQAQEFFGRWLLKDRVHATDLARGLAVQERRADQAERLAELGVFVSAVAHEVRNPLGVLSAHCRMLERRGADPETLAAMTQQIRRAERFVDDLLRYGRPRPLELRVLDVRSLLQLALSTARQGQGGRKTDEADGAGQAALDVVLDVEGELLVEADQAQLTQVLVILIDNALLALHQAPGPADPATTPPRLRLSARLLADRVQVAVEDSGPGIPKDVRGKLFQPFVTSRKRDEPRSGTGLGLAIARGIVERHHGKIRAGESDLGGALFSFDIPRTQALLAPGGTGES